VSGNLIVLVSGEDSVQYNNIGMSYSGGQAHMTDHKGTSMDFTITFTHYTMTSPNDNLLINKIVFGGYIFKITVWNRGYVQMEVIK
jgi:hypothetical protein